MTHEQSILAEDLEREAKIVADAQAAKRETLNALDRILGTVDACPDCGKTRSVAVVSGRHRRFHEGPASPQTHCACPKGPVARADEWCVEFVRGYKDAPTPMLRPASRAYGLTQLQPAIAPGDTTPQGPARFIPASVAFAWGEESPACRRLAYTILRLVTSSTVADRLAEAYMREVLATTIAKDSSRRQAVTLGEVRTWVSKQDASAGAAA